jgi:hypothetical protein
VARADPRSRHGVGAEEVFVQAARAAYRRAIGAGSIQANPATEAAMPSRPPSRRTALSPQQLRQTHLYLLARSRDPDLDDLGFPVPTGDGLPPGWPDPVVRRGSRACHALGQARREVRQGTLGPHVGTSHGASRQPPPGA